MTALSPVIFVGSGLTAIPDPPFVFLQPYDQNIKNPYDESSGSQNASSSCRIGASYLAEGLGEHLSLPGTTEHEQFTPLLQLR
jgi:hypothetical protein